MIRHAYRLFAASRSISLSAVTLVLVASVGIVAPQPALAQIVINEVDYDQSGTDVAEFIEIKNNGVVAESLDGYSLDLINGSGGGAVSYNLVTLPAVDLAAGDYYVVCGDAANVPECDLDITPDSNTVQNGGPDAVALLFGTSIVDSVSYEGDTAPPYTEGSGVGLEDLSSVDFAGISRFPDGTDTDQNNIDFSLRCITPGEANVAESTDCTLGDPLFVLNEVDYDQSGTDGAEFVEITNAGTAAGSLAGLSLELINGSGGGATVYQTFALPDVEIAACAFFVVCGDAAQVANCDLDVDPDTNLIQNGAPDAVALVDATTILDTVSYEGDTAAPYTETTGAGVEDDSSVDFAGIARFPDGLDTDDNSADWTQRCATPGLPNSAEVSDCAPPAEPTLVLNEVDYDQAGTDASEFIEIKNVGDQAVNLGGIALQLVNGSGGGAAVYQTFDLPAVDLAPGGFFVVCGDAGNVVRCDLDVTPDTNLVQNGGPDAVALVLGATLLDTVSYEGDTVAPYTEGTGVGLEDFSSVDFAGISRFPDGVDTDDNAFDWSLRCITPGEENVAESADCPEPLRSAVVVNEVDYDQPGSDAAEFVELKNVSSDPVSLAGYTLELVNGSGGGATVYQSYDLPTVDLPAGGFFVVCGNAATVSPCDLDVSPDTNLVQNGAPDAVGLRLDGTLVDAVSYEGDVAAPYTEGSGAGVTDDSGTDFFGISRVPDGFDTDQNANDFAGACITPGGPNTSLTTGCTPFGPTFEIFEIQGNGPASPFDGIAVRTADNVVTAVGPDGFFVQTPTERVDGDVETSDGIFVFTGSTPTVSVGDRVDVTGLVDEFFDLTEFTGNPLVVILSSGNAVPDPVIFDATLPSPDQPVSDNELERFEGMRVAFEGVATGPTDRFGDTPVVADPTRAFREPGIEFPGLAGLPVWDGNPEIFELDVDGLGLPDEPVFAGQTVSADGALFFTFGDYQVLPAELTLGPPPPLPIPVPERQFGELLIASQNVFRLFDDVDDPDVDDTVSTPEEFADRLTKFSAQIREVLQAPDVLLVQEIENLATLEALAAQIATDDPSLVYTAHLLEGNDVGGIDVGYLTRDDSFVVHSVEQFGADLLLSVDGSLLNDRPPLVLDGVFIRDGADLPVRMIGVHQRSLGGIEGSEAFRVKTKRLEQAQRLAEFIQEIQVTEPDTHLVVLGDFNAFQFTDGYVDVMGQLTGDLDPLGDEFETTDIVDPNLRNLTNDLPAAEQYSFIFGGSAQALDHALVSENLVPRVRGYAYGRSNADAPDSFGDDPGTPLRSSDHDGLVVYLTADLDDDGVLDPVDLCADTQIPESLPLVELRVLRFALTDGDNVFDTVLPPGAGTPPFLPITTEDTGGCSCEQILDELGATSINQRRFGCGPQVMRRWIRDVP